VLRKWRHKKRCRAAAGRCREAVLQRYLTACATLDTASIDDTPLISVDLELTGLDANTNQIVALGWTQITGGRIQLGSNRHLLITADESVGTSAAIHELTDSEVALGVEPKSGLEALFRAGEGRVWVFHHASLDVAFLQKACLEWAGVVPSFVVLDTMQIELARRKRREVPVQQGDLQLNRLRNDYHLPRYTAHNALIDAVATAELLLAIASRLDRGAPLKLSPYLRFT
jgi:DNA polymerase-3 subunit epsilon